MSKVYIKSNGGTGITWLTRDDQGHSQSLSRPPAEYLELLRHSSFRDDTAGLVVWASESGHCCVLVDSVFNGKRAGTAIVLESCLVIADDDQLTEEGRG